MFQYECFNSNVFCERYTINDTQYDECYDEWLNKIIKKISRL